MPSSTRRPTAASSPPSGRGRSRTLKVEVLARVEGEAGMLVRVQGDRVEEVRLNIFEPPRFFEAFLRGRSFREAPDITARICGICPVAYQMSACHAMERACGVRVEGALRELRRLLYCGEWIESHALHVYMLHAPDFLGYDSAMHMARDFPEGVRRGLELKKVGNEIVALLGGRPVHPVNVRLGGFYRVPSRRELEALVPRLEWAYGASEETLRMVAGFAYPAFERDYELVALRHPDEYPFNEGRLVSNRGLDIDVEAFENHFEELHVAHSNALHGRLEARGEYFVGPLARYNLNHDRLTPTVRAAAAAAGLGPVCRNPFQSIIVRGVELLWACEEALRILADYRPPAAACVAVAPRAATGWGATEAPRGLLYHRYQLAADGTITSARIVPPTAQNQPAIESDLRDFVATRLDLPDDELVWRCEQAIRNYDPCISCATHFLRLEIDRR